jgi:hypothetical protein
MIVSITINLLDLLKCVVTSHLPEPMMGIRIRNNKKLPLIGKNSASK